MTTLYLVRHGETVDNARQIMQGQTQGELNENGVRQAEEVSREWASLLRERDWGSFTGRYIPELKGEVWPNDIETLENLLSRAGEFIAYVKETFPGKKVLAVGHGIINKAVQAVYYGKSMSEIQRMTNAEVRILEL